MKKTRSLRLCLMVSAISLSLFASAADFTLADLEKMVRELEAVAIKNEMYKWPIRCSIVTDPRVNACATMEKPKGDEKPQALMEVNTGLIKEANGDVRLIRAVVAHEVAHLSKGHVNLLSYRARDLENVMTRQQEFEADSYGAALLQRAGYSKQDMVDMLLFLEKRRKRSTDWLFRLNSDHGDPKFRAARIADDPTVLRALLQFDVGLAFIESREFKAAADMFEIAVKIEPSLKEAWTNRALAKLLMYWQDLPGEVVNRYFRPEFGAFISTPSTAAKGAVVTSQNREQYREALAAIQDAIQKSGTARDREIMALAQILEPDRNTTTVKQGLDALKSMAGGDAEAQFRIKNNIAVGSIILGDVDGAYKLLLESWRSIDGGNHSAAENLGRIKVPKGMRSKQDLTLSKDIFKVWLTNNPQGNPAYQSVYDAYVTACGELGESPEKLQSLPTFLQPAVSLNHAGKDAFLFVGLTQFVSAFGKAELLVRMSQDYPDVFELRWQGGDFTLLAEQDKALKVTSYCKGDFLTIRPADLNLKEFYRVAVGDSVDNIKRWLNVDACKKRELISKGGLDTWNVYENLNFAMLVKDGNVAAISVTNIAPEN